MYNILYIYNIYLDRHPRASVLWRQYLRPQFFNQFLLRSGFHKYINYKAPAWLFPLVWTVLMAL